MGCSGKKCHERITREECVVLERSVMKESHREEKLMCCSGKKCHERITKRSKCVVLERSVMKESHKEK